MPCRWNERLHLQVPAVSLFSLLFLNKNSCGHDCTHAAGTILHWVLFCSFRPSFFFLSTSFFPVKQDARVTIPLSIHLILQMPTLSIHLIVQMPTLSVTFMSVASRPGFRPHGDNLCLTQDNDTKDLYHKYRNRNRIQCTPILFTKVNLLMSVTRYYVMGINGGGRNSSYGKEIALFLEYQSS